MSGIKVSNYQLQREREEKLRLVGSVSSAHSEVKGLRARVAELVGSASPGLRATFATQVAQAQAWLDGLDLPELRGLGMNATNDALSAAQNQLRRAAAEGRRFQEALTVAFTEKADEMARGLARRLAEVEQLFLKAQELLRLWRRQEELAAWEQAFQEMRRLLAREQYAQLEPALSALERELAAAAKSAEEREHQHQKRLYLLKSLRQVCAELGFQEVAEPRYEREGERASAIRFTVDTVDRGRIAFTLTLEGISSDSPVAGHHCGDEFEAIAKFLEEQFGIETNFKMADGSPLPHLKHRGEKDLPEDAGKHIERG